MDVFLAEKRVVFSGPFLPWHFFFKAISRMTYQLFKVFFPGKLSQMFP